MMTAQVTRPRRAALQEFLATRNASPRESDRVAVAVIRRALDLPPLPYSRFLGADCWLAGGSLLRWMCDEDAARHARKGDFDFFFPSLDALNATARTMLAHGFRLRGYRPFARTIRDFLRGGLVEGGRSGICDESGRLLALTPELVQRLRLSYLELCSPDGDTVQLVAFFRPTPLDTIIEFDLSICQLAANDQALSFGPWTRSDLMRGRLRAINIRWPVSTFQRVFRYARRGYRPYATTWSRVSYSFLVYSLQTLPPHLFRLSAQVLTRRRGQSHNPHLSSGR